LSNAKPKSPEMAQVLADRMRLINAARRGTPLAPSHRAKLSAVGVGRSVVIPIKGVCVYCGGSATVRDHVVAKSRGGANEPSNIVLACNSCNVAKGDRSLEEWLLSEAVFAERGSLAMLRIERLLGILGEGRDG
jgi:hypothetical protein